MHFGLVPHCAYCGHFIFCFNVDLTTEWGYCNKRIEGCVLSEDKISRIEEEVESGNYEILNYAKELGLFIPSFETICEHFTFSEESEFD